MKDAELKMVREFGEKFGVKYADKPALLSDYDSNGRFEFMLEELNEFHVASYREDLAGMADALVDLVYVAKGTALMLGLPWEELFVDVHRANMQKKRGKTERHLTVDCVKPAWWKGPETTRILLAAGYNDVSSV